MTDIVERLRAPRFQAPHWPLCVLLKDAADEIEQLRKYIAKHVGATLPATAAEIAEKIESQGGGIR